MLSSEECETDPVIVIIIVSSSFVHGSGLVLWVPGSRQRADGGVGCQINSPDPLCKVGTVKIDPARKEAQVRA